MDQLEAHRRAVATAQSVIDAVGSDQLGLPSPCTEWTVSEVIDHLVGGGWWVAGLVTGASPSGEASGPSAAFVESAAAAQAAFESDGALERMYELPFGTVPGAAWIGLRTTDVFTHAWDIAKATGQPTDLDPELATEALEASRMRIQPAFRGPGRPFQAEQPAPEGASVADQLAAFLGRTV